MNYILGHVPFIVFSKPHIGLGPHSLEAIVEPHRLELVTPHTIVVRPMLKWRWVHYDYAETLGCDPRCRGCARWTGPSDDDIYMPAFDGIILR